MKPTDWLIQLERLGLAIRSSLLTARDQGRDMSTPVACEGGDTIFAIDRQVEPAIEAAAASWVNEDRSVLVIAEGLGETGRKWFGSPTAPQRYRVLIDPIDGTRNIMYDKRAAWFLAAVAPDKGEETSLGDAVASVMVELPTSKQGQADALGAVKNNGAIGKRLNLTTGVSRALLMLPSSAVDLKQGFGQVSNFFPGTKELASQLMERIVQRTLGDVQPGSAWVFDDQYISTGGQMVELIMGRDRFCCDLRPLLYQVLEKQQGHQIRGLQCHPYDMAGLLVAQQAGVVMTDGWGRPLSLKMDVHSPVHWCGYANLTLAKSIGPVIVDWLKEKGIQP